MENVLRPICQEKASEPETLGIILVNKEDYSLNITDTFDAVLLIVVAVNEEMMYSKHYMYENKKITMHVITEQQLRKWLAIGSNPRLVEWLFYGKILFNRSDFLYKLRAELQEFPFLSRKIKTGIQYSMLIQRYIKGKSYFDEGEYFDSYYHVLEALHHLGRLSIIDNGLYPEVTFWSKVKKIEPAIYKLYEELTASQENLEQRLELLLLAIEFLIGSRMHDGAQHILEIMMAKFSWTIQELHTHSELSLYSTSLEVFVEYLVGKDYIEVDPVITKTPFLFHRNYKVNQELVKDEYGLSQINKDFI